MNKEYIERGAAVQALVTDYAYAAADLVSKLPAAADVVEVKHGRWIPTGMSNSTGPIVRCSVCGQYINPSATAIELNRQKLEPQYCEKCGALMDGGTRHAT